MSDLTALPYWIEPLIFMSCWRWKLPKLLCESAELAWRARGEILPDAARCSHLHPKLRQTKFSRRKAVQMSDLNDTRFSDAETGV